MELLKNEAHTLPGTKHWDIPSWGRRLSQSRRMRLLVTITVITLGKLAENCNLPVETSEESIAAASTSVANISLIELLRSMIDNQYNGWRTDTPVPRKTSGFKLNLWGLACQAYCTWKPSFDQQLEKLCTFCGVPYSRHEKYNVLFQIQASVQLLKGGGLAARQQPEPRLVAQGDPTKCRSTMRRMSSMPAKTTAMQAYSHPRAKVT